MNIDFLFPEVFIGILQQTAQSCNNDDFNCCLLKCVHPRLIHRIFVPFRQAFGEKAMTNIIITIILCGLLTAHLKTERQSSQNPDFYFFMSYLKGLGFSDFLSLFQNF